MGDHLAQVIRIQEVSGKIGQAGNVPALVIGPEKGLLERLVTIVGVIFCVYAIANDKNLHVLEQAAVDPERMPLVAVELVIIV